MINITIGNAGHLFVITSFVFAFVATVGYFLASRNDDLSWKKFGRYSFYFHVFCTVGIMVSLFYIIYTHAYEYYYAWSHSSNNLPARYMISCFWEGQEGSFLLWMFWHCVLGLVIIRTNKYWESSTMAVFSLVQAFLASMILGVVIGELKIGSSPFILLRNHLTDAPVFQQNPGFVPEDGTGLNPLLQNYWMVIHPPTLFLGFATTLVPFSYCIAGLAHKKYSEWLRPALPWTLFGAMILGTGILMGGYWAYETLNFGGYWNWDPVENAVYVPWLVMIGAVHTMITYRKNSKALKWSIILVIVTFLLILYSTFLTRSGVLGDSSVHSFTDLGLSGQLLIYLFAFIILGGGLLAYRWKALPDDGEKLSLYSREFWIFIGVLTLCLASFQVIFTTSIPVYNKIVELFGFESNLAPPSDQIAHYSGFQIWFAIVIAILSGMGQFFWWKKMDKKKLLNTLSGPLFVTLILVSGILMLSQYYDARIDKIKYILLITAALFSLIANGYILATMSKTSKKLTGGSIAHIGIALMFIGILYSSAYSKVVSRNTTGMVYSEDFTEDMNAENLLLWQGKQAKMDDFRLTYKGPRVETKDYDEFIDKRAVRQIDKYQAVITDDIRNDEGELIYHEGDTVRYYPENTYYEILYQDGDEKFTLYPRAQVNDQMGLLASPDIKKLPGRDLYTHVSSIPDPEEGKEWSEPDTMRVSVGDTFIVNDFVATFENAEQLMEVRGIAMSRNDAAVKARIKIMGSNQTYTAAPVFIIKDQKVGRLPATLEGIGIRANIISIDPGTGNFTLSFESAQRDWIILKAVEKPLINVLWLGTGLLVIGFCIAIYRRYSDFRKMRDKGMEVRNEENNKLFDKELL